VDLLRPDKSVAHVDAVVLTGGSAFGLAAADGVMRYYEQAGRGVATPTGPVPIIPALALYDLAVGNKTVRPTAEDGYAAAVATAGEQVLFGRVGAGAGAYVSHWRGPQGRRPAGLVSHVARLDDLVVGVLCAVNAFGDIDDGGEALSFDAVRSLSDRVDAADGRIHTTIGIVCTNATLNKAGCLVVAQGAHDGLSRAVTPPHTRFDGDAFVTCATGQIEAHLDIVRYLALVAVCQAIRSIRPTQ
jgi:L-aminopeptidase/D-esterase-like protein